MKKIKVIDLLNIIANEGEVPEIIYEDKTKYKYDKNEKDYYTGMGYDYEYFFKNMKTIWLNDEVEIIEEKTTNKIEEKTTNKIEKLDLDNDELLKNVLITKQDFVIEEKINEIIDVLNELKR